MQLPKGNRIHPTFSKEDMLKFYLVVNELNMSYSTVLKGLIGLISTISTDLNEEDELKLLSSLIKHGLIKEELIETKEDTARAVDVEVVSKEITKKLKMRKI